MDNNNSQSNTNTLFSSSSCRYCKLFMNTLNTHMMLDQFNIIDIEKTAFDVSKVRVVPTIVVNNSRALSGRDAFSWLQNEIATAVSGVESFGMSSAFSYISEERAEVTMSSTFVNIDETPTASAERAPLDDGKSQGDVETAMERIKAERSAN